MVRDNIKVEVLETDILVIGGGTAGCLAAIEIKEKNPQLDVLIIEKAHIKRSGCLAAGMNAINAYLNPGETPESFVKYVRSDAMGLVREDLVLSMAKELNPVVKRLETWGLSIKKDESGNYIPRGRWNIKINGESLKPIIAQKVADLQIRVLNRVVTTNLIVEKSKVKGAMGFGVRDGKFYVLKARASIVATGGAAGLYKPNNDGSSHHKIWYSPFNTGAGYAMGIRAGAEMTSFEMRFIALRTKDIIAPTGTLALGFGAKQVNALGQRFMKDKYAHMGAEGAPTPLRVFGPIQEIKEGRGPVFMDTTHLSTEEIKELKKSYLNMYPDLVLFWAANGFDPSEEPVEIMGTEPYLVGGHAQAGYWITPERQTTLVGLFAAGDVAGGVPYKFVSGCCAEGVIAGRSAVKYVKEENTELNFELGPKIKQEINRVYYSLYQEDGIKAEELEERLQKTMDEYAGGVSRYYEMNEMELSLALKKVKHMQEQTQYLKAEDLHQLMNCHEVIDRLDIAEVLINHLLYRQETRWPAYQSRVDYPERNDRDWLKFVNSYYQDNKVIMQERPYEKVVAGDRYLAN